MKILSIDPGFEKIGYALFSNHNPPTFISSGLIFTDKKLHLSARLQRIYEEITVILKEEQIESVVMEQLLFSKNKKTAIQVAHAQGVIMFATENHGCKLHFINPMTIKSIITGSGSADKKSIHQYLTYHLGTSVSVADDDESDAIACGLAFCYSVQKSL